MRRKQRTEDTSSALPPVLAAGPTSDSAHDVRAWRAACNAWALAHGYGWTGYRALLPEPLRRRYAATARERLAPATYERDPRP